MITVGTMAGDLVHASENSLPPATLIVTPRATAAEGEIVEMIHPAATSTEGAGTCHGGVGGRTLAAAEGHVGHRGPAALLGLLGGPLHAGNHGVPRARASAAQHFDLVEKGNGDGPHERRLR